MRRELVCANFSYSNFSYSQAGFSLFGTLTCEAPAFQVLTSAIKNDSPGQILRVFVQMTRRLRYRTETGKESSGGSPRSRPKTFFQSAIERRGAHNSDKETVGQTLARILQVAQPVAHQLDAAGIKSKDADQNDVLRMTEFEMDK
jgi:hypothetical protein